MVTESEGFDRGLPAALVDAFHALADGGLDAVCLLDVEGRLVAANAPCVALLGVPAERLHGAPLPSLGTGRPAEEMHDLARRILEDGPRRLPMVFHSGDDARPVAMEATLSVLSAGGTRCVLMVLRDFSETGGADDVLREAGERYRALFEQSRDVLYITDEAGCIVDVNRAAVDLFGRERLDMIGTELGTLFADAEDRERFAAEVQRRGTVRDLEVRLRRETGEEIHCLISSSERHNGTGDVVGRQGIIHDFTARKLAEERLWRAAVHDALTGLPNRNVFIDRLKRSIGRARRRLDYQFAVLFLDLDRFKTVNDSFGHLAGDALLVQAARRIEASIRPEDTLARIGGDEFAVLLYNVSDPAYVQHIAQRIQERLRDVFAVDGHEAYITASVGIALSSGEYHLPEDVLRDADIAMYRAKKDGREHYAFFEPRMGLEAAERINLERDLRYAVARGELRLHYQPLVSLSDRRLTGFEALVRWQHPERGLIPPGEFIPLAEEIEFIEEIDYWVLTEACRQMRNWHGRFPGGNLTINVNLSGKVFLKPDLVEGVDRALAETGLNPCQLRIEVTENVLLHNVELVSRHFQALKERGIKLCIDDFGIGYSSLSYLSRFPIDVLKIDRSFVEGLEGQSSSREIVRAIVTLAQNLGLEAVAEGAETDSQLASLRELGSQFAQGFLFSRPVDADTAEALIRDGLALQSGGPGVAPDAEPPPEPREGPAAESPSDSLPGA